MGTMTAFLIVCALGLCGFACAIAHKLLSDMVAEELRTRIDRLAGCFARLAARRLPPDIQDDYRPDYEGALLAAFYDETAGVPVTRFFKAIWVGASFWLGAGRIRKETKLAQQTAKNDEKSELLAVIESGVVPNRQFDFVFEDNTGRTFAAEFKEGSFSREHIVALKNGGIDSLYNVRLWVRHSGRPPQRS
jgi:hypothetical protein